MTYRGSLGNFDLGPVSRPLDIAMPPREPGDLPSATLVAKMRRKIADNRMRRFRSVPVSRQAWFVTLTATEVMRDSFGKSQLVRGLEFRPQQFWVHARRVARIFLRADEAAGGKGSAFAVEYRRCKVCGRILLAAEAKDYREKERRPHWAWEYPDFGPACSVDCKPKTKRRKDVASEQLEWSRATPAAGQ